jgi:acetyltransferase-like isoleucine patch superfamily enzyme
MGATDPRRPGLLRSLGEYALELSGTYRLPALARGSMVAWSARVKTPSRLHMGRNCTIQRGAIVHCGGKAWCGYGGHVNLGEGVVIGPYCVVYGAAGIDLDDFVHLGPGVKLMSQSGLHDRNRLGPRPSYKLEPISIGAGSWIGAGAVVLGGTKIGRCVTVAPNSVVGGDVPDYAVVAGNPSRAIIRNETFE